MDLLPIQDHLGLSVQIPYLAPIKEIQSLSFNSSQFMIYKVDPSQTITETTLDEILQQEKWTLLYFYPKNDTPGCTLEAQDFTRLAQDFAKFNIQIV